MIFRPGKDDILFVPLGGAGEIGMNLYLYGYKGKWLIVDCGITFGDVSDPAVDVAMADPTFIEERKKDLVGIVVTHGHEDHLGAIPHLWPYLKCPVYATPFTAAFLREKLAEEGLGNDVPLKEIPLGGRWEAGPFDLQFVSLAHSIPEPNLLAIRTEHGIVAHTGDYKFDADPVIGEPADEAGLKALGDEGVLAVFGDSTNVLSKGHSGSEGEVQTSLKDLIARYEDKGRIAVTCFASNIARVKSIAIAAEANGRSVSLVGRSLWRMTKIAREQGYLEGIPPFLDEEEGAYLPREKALFICTGSQGEGRAALSRIAFDAHRHVVLDRDDVVIFSSKAIPGNEKTIIKVENQLAKLGVHTVTEKEEFVHVSGHPKRDEVAKMYGLLRPRYVIPVHGEAMHLLEHADFAEKELGAEKSFVIENGQMIRLGDAFPEILGDTIETGRLIIDGDRLVHRDSALMRDRRKIVYNGAACATLVLDGKGLVRGKPMIAAPGLFDDEDDAETLYDLQNRLVDAIEDLHPKERKKDEAVREQARIALRRGIAQTLGRKPIVSVHVVRC